MWKQAIDDAVGKIRNNIETFGDGYPHVGVQGRYSAELNANKEWTSGFWSGLLWLAYEYTNDPVFREAAVRTVESFRERLHQNDSIEHHDIGFLYSLSAKAQWIIEKDEAAKALTIEAANKLMTRWREEGRYIQAWGPLGDPKEGGRIIIDCLMNLPLLYWASKTTGDPLYGEIAATHAELSRRYLVRGDDSSYHTFYFDQFTGEPVGGSTAQGYRNGSTWTRGQAWGVYGFALSYRYTGNPLFLDTSKRLAKYFLSHLPSDHVAYWDFDVPVEPSTFRDSSASAIVCAGLQELLEHLPAEDQDRTALSAGLEQSMKSLVTNYATIGQEAEGLLRHGSYSVRGGNAPDDFMIWGDYYYLEALLRLELGLKGYWYES
ncbi:glycoside hydrolase family 88 protein [Paenibacillus filicis]|uniref:Glycoside hydrolase family 88 protein n=1 Tax=Paenibacillus gyeongsangnamensis TaxID=3388067 RepID=A0ABT4QBJ2_9BACL|nr:glycoside hydrolase family 88 protein [Paenibacillus filicis]MCZ8514245.1 glycoside hydrolase family 88 protein [Paenibacillus filicis]